MNTRAVTYIENKTVEVINEILDEQENNTMNKYTPLISNNSFKVRLADPFKWSGDVRNKLGEATLRDLLSEEHQRERFEANKELPKLNKEWGKLQVKREKLRAKIAKLTDVIDTTTPKIRDNPELAGKVVQATDERKLLDLEVAKLSATMGTFEKRMDTLANTIEDWLVKHSKKTLEAIAILRESIDKEEAEAKLRLDYANRALKGKFELPAELSEQIEVPEVDEFGATVINRATLDKGYGSVYNIEEEQLQALNEA